MADRRDIEFDAEGVTLRGWLYTPAAEGPTPIIVMAHGFSAVKEMYLDRFGEAFADAGMAALVYDNRNFGASDGEPRQEIIPWQQVEDYRHAITYAQSLPGIDASRIGVWGSSYSGAHVLALGAIDNRIKCVVSQVPMISGYHNARALIRRDMFAPTRELLEQDRADRYAGKAPGMIPVVSNDPLAPCALPTADSYDWFIETGKSRAPSWRNEVTLRSIEKFLEYEPGVHIPRISPTPVCFVVAERDHLTPAEYAIEAYEKALEPKRLVILDGGHFDAYVAGFDEASAAARDWFVEHLRP
jgi:fermentation-respiration switch protein FrsA (DUF1100 family)